MAALKIGRKKPKQETTSSKRDEVPSLTRSKSPVFTVQYLGKLPAGGEYGREFISDPVECLLKSKEKERLPKTTLTVSEKGFHFLDQDGPFGKEKHVLIPLHNICYGVADEQSPRVFAIITRTDSNSDHSLFECHAFLCDKRKTSSEITYWLLRTFLQVFEELQKKRKLRKERKRLRKQQQIAGNEVGVVEETVNNGRPSKGRSTYSPETAVESGSYSVILEGSKGHGAAVRLTLNRSKSHHSSNVTSTRNTHGNEHQKVNNDRDLNANFSSRIHQGPSRTINADIHPHTPQIKHEVHNQQEIPRLPHARNTYMYSGGVYSQPPQYTDQHLYPSRTHVAQPQVHRPSFGTGRYTRNNLHSPNASSTREGTYIAQSNIQDDSDFLFIDLLQEEFTDGRHEEGFLVRSGRMGKVIGPPNERLRSEDIERRIHEWLSAKVESTDDNISAVEDETSQPAESVRRQFSRCDTVSLPSSDTYF